MKQQLEINDEGIALRYAILILLLLMSAFVMICETFK